MDPRQWSEGFYELGSVHPSFRPTVRSGSFLGIGSLVFSETQHGVRGPCGVVIDRAENGENEPKIVFFFFEFIGNSNHENFFLNLAYKESSNYLLYLLHKCHTWEKSGS